MPKVTITDVANYAGVSKKTVSRVLNKEPNVSDKTNEKVKAAFKKLSYRPNPQARGLASNQSFLIGLVYDNPNKSYVSDVQTGALSVCNKEGYHLLIHPTDHESEEFLEDIQLLISQSQLDGIVLTPPFSDRNDLLEMLNKQQIPFVRIGPTININSGICVFTNDELASYDMTQHLISLGHTKIGFIKGHPHHNVSAQRFDGYQRALDVNGIHFESQYVVQGFFDYSSGEQCARKLLALERGPTAIFASNDYMAAGVLKVASQKNIPVPQRLSVVGFDDTPISSHMWPSLTTVSQPVKLMATQALELLIKLIRKYEFNDAPLEHDYKLVIRESSSPMFNE